MPWSALARGGFTCVWKRAGLIVGLLLAIASAARGQEGSAASGARLRYWEERANLNRIRMTMDRELAASPQWQKAESELAGARARVDALRGPIFQGVWKRPQYQSLWRQKQAAEARLEGLRNDPMAQPKQIRDLAYELLRLRQALSHEEAAALAAEPKLAQARRELAAASLRLIELRVNHERQVPANPAWFAARQRLETANAQAVAAEAAQERAAAAAASEAHRQRLASMLSMLR